MWDELRGFEASRRTPQSLNVLYKRLKPSQIPIPPGGGIRIDKYDSIIEIRNSQEL